nr:MAG TPA: hypothetical protein [Caudoviricetes sp.]DAU59296.1 MAG TPA: hypothetical protein [Crassvirales sp.]
MIELCPSLLIASSKEPLPLYKPLLIVCIVSLSVGENVPSSKPNKVYNSEFPNI